MARRRKDEQDSQPTKLPDGVEKGQNGLYQRRGRGRPRGSRSKGRTADDDLVDAVELYLDPLGRSIHEILVGIALGVYKGTPTQLAAIKLVLDRIAGKPRLAKERKVSVDRVWNVILGDAPVKDAPQDLPRELEGPGAEVDADLEAEVAAAEAELLEDVEPERLEVADDVSLDELVDAEHEAALEEPVDAEYEVVLDDAAPEAEELDW